MQMLSRLVVQFLDLHGNFKTQLAINRMPNKNRLASEAAK
uniref:Uncharacterized protein n=1 Tax=Romanomermis culicivorax TaxID=13658 RepID=A0A915HIX3_ROMCU